MATKSNFSLVSLVVVSAIFMVMFFSVVPAMADDVKQTNMILYFQDYSGGPNASSLPMVGFPGKLWSATQFGTLIMTDDLMTEGPEPTSAVVGRGHGITVTTSLDGLNVYLTLSLIFTNEAYNGSTILIQGGSYQFSAVREYGVVSGTGKFRYATGYITFETLSKDPSTFYTLLRGNLSVRHC